jgi:hypothetical protein
MDSTTLIVGVFAGAIGVGYFVYGKKQQRIVPLVCGVGLCAAPYFIDALWGQLAVCGVLTVLPFLWRV